MVTEDAVISFPITVEIIQKPSKRQSGGILGAQKTESLPKSYLKKLEKEQNKRIQKIVGQKISAQSGLVGEVGASCTSWIRV